MGRLCVEGCKLGVHGLISLLLAGFGLAGAAAFCLPLTALGFEGRKDLWVGFWTLCGLLLIVGLFVIIFHWWFGILVGLWAREAQKNEAS
jgi:hypothetical protein